MHVGCAFRELPLRAQLFVRGTHSFRRRPGSGPGLGQAPV